MISKLLADVNMIRA